MTEIGGLLDPFGRLWGLSIAHALLALVPNKAILRGRWVLIALSVLALIFAIISSVYASRVGILFWSAVPSALIYAAIFYGLGRLGLALGHRFSKKAPNPADDSPIPGGDSTK